MSDSMGKALQAAFDMMCQYDELVQKNTEDEPEHYQEWSAALFACRDVLGLNEPFTPMQFITLPVAVSITAYDMAVDELEEELRGRACRVGPFAYQADCPCSCCAGHRVLDAAKKYQARRAA